MSVDTEGKGVFRIAQIYIKPASSRLRVTESPANVIISLFPQQETLKISILRAFRPSGLINE